MREMFLAVAQNYTIKENCDHKISLQITNPYDIYGPNIMS